ncbi:hypothetical protein ABGB18_32385 [Nonomuraea sp. B12E4]|uniref:hypothetical protein n=1 Tax=Nonomuraea sp. B12E4 TaxID=3153564 RepID=UPI00325EAD19
MLTRFLRTFVPWIAFTILGQEHDSRLGALVAVALAAIFLTADRRRGRALAEMVIEVSSVAFFGTLALVSCTLSPAPLGPYGTAAAAAWLAVTAWGTLAIRRPFTLAISRTAVPAEVHDNPAFYRVNAVITAAWATAFTLEAVALLLVITVAPHVAIAIIAVKVCAIAAPALFTVRYPRILATRRGTT